MKRTGLFIAVIICLYAGHSQEPYYYYDATKIFLGENQYVRYIGLDTAANIAEREHLLDSLTKNVILTDTFSSVFYRFHIDDNKLDCFLQTLSNNENLVGLNTPELYYEGNSILWAEREIFAKLKSHMNLKDVLDSANVPYNRIDTVFYDSNLYYIHLSTDSSLEYANILYETGLFDYAEPNFSSFITLDGLEDNPMYSSQWAIHNDSINIDLLRAWSYTTGNNKIKIALVDCGVELNHPDLNSNLEIGFDAVVDEFGELESAMGGNEDDALNAHGTQCAGIISAINNNIGNVGVAYTSRLIPIRVVYTASYSTRSTNPPFPPQIITVTHWNNGWFVNGLYHAVYESNADIISCSLGGKVPSNIVGDAISNICTNGRNGKGVIMVVAAGNIYTDSITVLPEMRYIATNPNVISVGSITQCGKRVQYHESCEISADYTSCYGDSLDVVAPGISVPTTQIGADYSYGFSGTSSACPHVAGVAALVLSVNPCLTREEVTYILESTCTKVRPDLYNYGNNTNHPNGTWNNEVGYGLVNAYEAVLLAQQMGGYVFRNQTVIQSNTTWDTVSMINDDLIIDSLATLTITDTLHIAGGSSIIVHPGGKLIVNGGTLTSACEGEMWQGIIVEGNCSLPQYAQRQGSVILNNATVENARNAISTRGADTNAVYEHTGGIVQATNTLFRNNLCSMEMSLYENRNVAGDTIDNTSHFNNCTFRIDTANLFPANNCTFVQHVSLWGVRGVKFNGCTFQNQDTTHSYVNRGRALYTADAGYRCRRICPVVSDTDPCACQPSGSQPVVRCSFTGFYKAIESTGDCGQGSIVIDNCDFANNFVGIVLNASDNAQVSYNHFNLDFSQERNSGLRLVGSTGFTVEDNDFVRMLTTQDTIYGIICDNTGNAENFIRRNDFSNLFYGCYSLKNNGPIANRPRGLQFNCNSYTANTYDIYVPANSTIRNVQGSSNKGADNDFSNTLTRSLTIPMTMNTLSYYYSSGNSHIPVGTSNYTGYGTATANPCASTLCGLQNPGFPPGIIRYASLSEEYELLSDKFERRGYGAILSDRGHYTDSEVQDAMVAESRLDSLSVEMAELSNRGIKAVIQDSVMDFSQLKDWFGVINTLSAKYLLIETYYLTGDYAAANWLLSALPDMFDMSEGEQEEYENYRAFHALRNTLAGDPVLSGGASVRRNWAELTEPELAELQRIAEGTQGRTATMAQGILCFFHHICYEEDMALNLGDIGERNLGGDAQDRRTRCVPTDNGLAIYPNPADGTLTVESASPIREITVYDLSGRVMMTMGGNGTASVETTHALSLRQDINVSSLPAGIYLLRVVTEKGVETGRFVKN